MSCVWWQVCQEQGLSRKALVLDFHLSEVPQEVDVVRRRKRWRNKHHLIPRSRFGSDHRSNLLLLDGNIHRNLHRVFGNRTLDEIIKLLQRIQRAKRRQSEDTQDFAV